MMRGRAWIKTAFILLIFSTSLSFALPPLYFALGLEDVNELTEYAKWGFNSLWVDMVYQDSQLDKKETLIKQAAEQGLIPIICLHTELKDLGFPSPLNKEYGEKTTSWVKAMAEKFKDIPQLIWALGYDPAGAIEYSEADFLSYLLSWYGSLPTLSQAWGTELNFPSELTLDLVEKISADREGEIPRYGITRASLDLAIYKWWSLRDLLNLWLGEIRGADGNRRHWVITGMLKDYKSLISVPQGYDGVTVALYPGEVESDFLTHNSHGIAIARRGGLFNPIGIFRLIKEGEYKTTPYILKEWLNNAYLQGAVGIGIDNWATLKELSELKQVLPHAFLKQPLEPRNKIAVLYEPFLEGYNLAGRGLYGFLKTPLLNQPSDLFFALRLGSKYGGIDFLSVDDLDKLNLSRYKVILAPSAFYLPPPAKELLQSFILLGGMLVADIGLDCYESGLIANVSDFVRRDFGVDGVFTITKGRGNFRINMEHPLFPLLRKNQESDGNAKGFAVDGCIGFIYVGAKTDILATLGALLGAGGRMAVAGIIVKKVGLGYTVYATFPLWRNWLPYNKLFNEFHESVFSWGAEGWLVDTLFPSVGRFALLQNGFALANLTPLNTALILKVPEQIFFEGCITAPAEDYPFEIIVPLEKAELRVLSDPLPLVAQPGYLLVQVGEYSSAKVELRVWGRGGKALVGDNQVGVVSSFTTPGVLNLFNGEYKIEKGSSHKVTITNLQTGEKKSFLLKAEEDSLRIEWDFHSERVEIEKG